MHAALGDPGRLAVVEELTGSDRAPSELAGRLGMAGNLLAHHLKVLERVGLVDRVASSGDRRRRYVRLRRAALADLGVGVALPEGPVLFVCSQNSARSQLAAALWRHRRGGAACSAGTRPAGRIDPGAVAAARRNGLDLDGAQPRGLDEADVAAAALVVTVCDQAHEELSPPVEWWHWSVPDPVAAGDPAAFDAALDDLDARIHHLGP
jgi:ArsR family transcriptional regulator, arsenate/arsenite/antimonite-responsive transcriptional repressor / arsenate reductase (thioredoxin)